MQPLVGTSFLNRLPLSTYSVLCHVKHWRWPCPQGAPILVGGETDRPLELPPCKLFTELGGGSREGGNGSRYLQTGLAGLHLAGGRSQGPWGGTLGRRVFLEGGRSRWGARLTDSATSHAIPLSPSGPQTSSQTHNIPSVTEFSFMVMESIPRGAHQQPA